MKKLIVATVTSLLVAGCANNEQLGILIGAAAGGLAGHAACDGKASCIAIGALAGAVIGGAIAHYLTPQDQANISTTLDDTDNSEAVAWCSDTKQTSSNVSKVKCGNKNKIVATPQPVIANATGEMCRNLKTDVEMPNGNIETATQTVCKGQDGKWHTNIA